LQRSVLLKVVLSNALVVNVVALSQSIFQKSLYLTETEDMLNVLLLNPGGNVIKLFFFTDDNAPKQAEVFVSDNFSS
jgi:hypothetical protein